MAFFNDASHLASLFTPPRYHDPERDGKYSVGGLKPIEAFCSDISDNLTEWAFCRESIFYKTPEHWYEFRLETKGDYRGVVWMTRYDTHSWARLDSWANRSSVESMGKAFLAERMDKLVPLFNEG